MSNHAGHQDNAQEQLGIDLQLRHSNLLVKSSRLPSICVTDDDEDEDLCTASCLFVCLPVCARRALAHKSARKYTHKCCTSVRAFCACCTQQRRLAHGNSDAVVLGCVFVSAGSPYHQVGGGAAAHTPHDQCCAVVLFTACPDGASAVCLHACMPSKGCLGFDDDCRRVPAIIAFHAWACWLKMLPAMHAALRRFGPAGQGRTIVQSSLPFFSFWRRGQQQVPTVKRPVSVNDGCCRSSCPCPGVALSAPRSARTMFHMCVCAARFVVSAVCYDN